MTFDLSTLNAEQLKPVLDTQGAVLVTAGAGSGKTRLLTHRIAHLIVDKGVMPYNILAITFTNKAADEMRERLNIMIPDSSGLWVSTFHSMCSSILRKHIDKIGYSTNFSIYGENEKERTIKKLIKENNIDEDLYKKIMFSVSDAKNNDLSPEDYKDDNKHLDNIDEIYQVLKLYENDLKKCNALDFDDLLIKTFFLLKNCAEVSEYYSDKFHYIHVDEFQDTNIIQYKIVKELGKKHKNIFIVGDEDQSIYGWRGASVTNIFNFTQEYDCKIYKLEQNYRSTKKIIAAANKVIENNTSRIKKVLWTDKKEGDEIEIYPAQSENAEADFVVGKIMSEVRQGNCSYSDFAILMRINALTRPFEERLMQYGIPHKIFGGFKFYERKEIKDLLAYFRILVNNYDNEAITRVINFPKRGIGDATVSQVVEYCIEKGCSLLDAILSTLNPGCELKANIVKKISPFAAVIGTLKEQADKIKHSDLLKFLIKLLNLKDLYADDTEENENRKQNIKQLLNAVTDYENRNPGAVLEEYLQSVSLYSDLDEMSEDDSFVNIATVHSAKGLEFKTVFVIGLEDGVFPITRSMDSTSETEEERRLMYVAVTRAKEKLYLSYAQSRFLYNERKPTFPSRFLRELGYSAPAQRSMYDSYNESRRNNYSNSSYTKSYIEQKTPVENKIVSNFMPPVPQKQSNVLFEKFVEGAKVTHKKFGQGIIISVSGENENAYALIEFETVGKLTLSLSYAPLEVVG